MVTHARPRTAPARPIARIRRRTGSARRGSLRGGAAATLSAGRTPGMFGPDAMNLHAELVVPLGRASTAASDRPGPAVPKRGRRGDRQDAGLRATSRSGLEKSSAGHHSRTLRLPRHPAASLQPWQGPHRPLLLIVRCRWTAPSPVPSRWTESGLHATIRRDVDARRGVSSHRQAIRDTHGHSGSRGA